MKYPRKMPEILQYISQGFSQKEAYEKAGVSQTQFYKWMAENTEFADMVHKAQEDYRSSRADIEAVERALVESAKGYEVEDVKTEYISRQDPATKKYVPVISKQVRTTKKVAPNVEATIDAKAATTRINVKYAKMINNLFARLLILAEIISPIDCPL